MIGDGKNFAAMLVALALAACGEAEQPAAPAAAPIPQQLCSESKKGLDELSKSGSFEYSAEGVATLEEAVWLTLADGQRDALAQALAFHAACEAAEPPRETSITIKNEGGRVLTQRVIETSADISRILKN